MLVPFEKPFDLPIFAREERFVYVNVRCIVMKPTLYPGAIVVVDTQDKRVVSGELFCIHMPGEGKVIRRLYATFDGIEIHVDAHPKSVYFAPPFTVTPARLDDLIFGRVVFVMQQLKKIDT